MNLFTSTKCEIDKKEECPVNTPKNDIMPVPFCQLRTRKISPFSDKSDVRSLRCKDKRFGLCRFLANHSLKTPPFFLQTNLYWSARHTLPKCNKKVHSLQDCGLSLLIEAGMVIFGSSPKGACLLLSNLRCKYMN